MLNYRYHFNSSFLLELHKFMKQTTLFVSETLFADINDLHCSVFVSWLLFINFHKGTQIFSHCTAPLEYHKLHAWQNVLCTWNIGTQSSYFS